MSAILELLEGSQLARVDAAATLGAIEAALRPRGLSLGPFPIESGARTLGEALGAPRPAEATPRGRFADRCAALDAVLAGGGRLSTRLAPRKATGPDFTAAFLGAHGHSGRIAAAWMRLQRWPEPTGWVAFAFAGGTADAGGQALERALRLFSRSLLPADLAIVDEPLFGAGAAGADAVVVVARFEGPAELVAAEVAVAGEVLAAGAGGGRELAAGLGARFLLRRQPLPPGQALVPVVELARLWSQRRAPAVLCGQLPDRPAWCSHPAGLPSPQPVDPAATAAHARLQLALSRVEGPGP